VFFLRRVLFVLALILMFFLSEALFYFFFFEECMVSFSAGIVILGMDYFVFHRHSCFFCMGSGVFVVELLFLA